MTTLMIACLLCDRNEKEGQMPHLSPNLTISSGKVDGDSILVSNTHSHSYTVNTTLDFGASVSIISVDNSNRENELLGAVESSGANRLYFSSISSQVVTVYSMKFSASDFIYINNAYIKFRSIRTEIEVLDGPRLQIQNGSSCTLISSTLSTTAYIALYGGTSLTINDLYWVNVTPDYLVQATTQPSDVLIENTDIAAIIPATTPMFRSLSASKFTVRNCKIGVNQVILLSNSAAGTIVDVISCDNGSGYHYFYHWRYEGEVSESIAAYLNYSYDGTNKASALLNSSSAANIGSPLRYKLCEIPAQDLSVTDTTYRVNLLLDTDTQSTLTDAEFWVELVHNDNTTLALGKEVSSRNTDILATGMELTTSAEVWQGTLPTNNKAYQVDITLSAAQLTNVTNGNVEIYVNLATPNTDVYVCPAVQIGT